MPNKKFENISTKVIDLWIDEKQSTYFKYAKSTIGQYKRACLLLETDKLWLWHKRYFMVKNGT